VKIWKVILATLVIFVAGVLTGAIVTRFAARPPHPLLRFREPETKAPVLVSSNREPRLTLPFSRPPARGLSKEFLARLDEELKLAPEQHRRIDKILEESQKRNKQLWETIAPELREEMKHTREQIREVLTPEQRKRMDELMKRPPKAPKEGQPTNAAPLAAPVIAPPKELPAQPPDDSPAPPAGPPPQP
jgi:hypothetical protein